MVLRVSEIFTSVQGEGPLAGLPMTFIRLYGCDKRCPWCDSSIALQWKPDAKYEEIDIRDIYDQIIRLGTRWVSFTGGEPTLQADELVSLFKYMDQVPYYRFSIETHGDNPKELLKVAPYLSQVVVSPKLPSSGEPLKLPRTLREKYHEFGAVSVHCPVSLKFVIDPAKDLEEFTHWMTEAPNERVFSALGHGDPRVFVQPVDYEGDAYDSAWSKLFHHVQRFLKLAPDSPPVVTLPQIHKLLGMP